MGLTLSLADEPGNKTPQSAGDASLGDCLLASDANVLEDCDCCESGEQVEHLRLHYATVVALNNVVVVKEMAMLSLKPDGAAACSQGERPR